MSVPYSIQRYMTDVVDVDEEGNDVYDDPWRMAFLETPLDEISKVLTEATALPKCTSVYYPGSAGDIASMFMHTDCTTLIGCDLMDPTFYPLSSVSLHPPVLLQAAEVVKQFQLLNEIEQGANFELNHLTTTEDSYTLRFSYRGRQRTATEYFRDAYTFRPPPVDLVFLSGFSLPSHILEQLDTKYIVSEDETSGTLMYYYWITPTNVRLLSLETGMRSLTAHERLTVRAAFLRIFIGRKQMYLHS